MKFVQSWIVNVRRRWEIRGSHSDFMKSSGVLHSVDMRMVASVVGEHSASVCTAKRSPRTAGKLGDDTELRGCVR